MSKKLIIITVAGLASFAGAFVFAWQTYATPPGQHDESDQSALANQESELKLLRQGTDTMGTIGAGNNAMKKAMTEKQLKNLVYDVREKIQEYDNKLRSLEAREQRLQMAQEMLKGDIENLNSLRIELAAAVATLKSERDKLVKSRVNIQQAEKANLVTIAATYDKMDPASASKILTNMCTQQIQKGTDEGWNSYMDDAVKILYYMNERTKAKLLAELATSEPKLAAVLCRKLKQVIEGQ